MKRFLTALLPISLLLSLNGCATLDKSECLTADWRDLGRQDGRAGYPAARLAEHREACIEHGVKPDERRYQKGREEGLQDYCQLDNALREGLAGRRYQNVCPSGIHQEFRDLNEAANGVHDLSGEIEGIDSTIEGLETELRNEKTSDKRRNRIHEEIHDLDRRRDRLQDDLYRSERALDRLSDQLMR